jgi:putative membrane protein insertion efficiency factor
MKVISLLLRGLVRLYQWTISPILAPRCRFLPTCSEYAIDAIDRHRPLAGGWLALKRIARCHPWADWGYDPVPDAGARRDADDHHAAA